MRQWVLIESDTRRLLDPTDAPFEAETHEKAVKEVRNTYGPLPIDVEVVELSIELMAQLVQEEEP